MDTNKSDGKRSPENGGRGGIPVIMESEHAALEGVLGGRNEEMPRAPGVGRYGPENFGADHWELLRYLEERVVQKPAVKARQNGGTRGAAMPAASHLDRERMRCNPARHLEAAALKQLTVEQKKMGRVMAGLPPTAATGFEADVSIWEQSRCTTLSDGSRALHHDDYDCLADLERAKLARIVSERRGIFTLTEAGMRAAHAYRVHRAMGGTPEEFSLYKNSPYTERDS